MMRWGCYLVVSLLVNAITYFPLAFILPLFADDKGWLPNWLQWASTHDNNLDGDQSDWTSLPNGSYWRRVFWIWKNPCYAFEQDVLGAEIAGLDVRALVVVQGNVNIKNRDNGVAGEYRCTIGAWWNHKKIVDLGIVLGQRRCWMLETGWKLQDYAKDPHYISVMKPQWVFSPRITVFTPAIT